MNGRKSRNGRTGRKFYSNAPKYSMQYNQDVKEYNEQIKKHIFSNTPRKKGETKREHLNRISKKVYESRIDDKK